MITIREIGRSLRAREYSCVELVHKTLGRIEREDRSNSFITLTRERALAEAEQRDRELAAGLDRGPFHGVPVAYKDIIHTQNIRTTGGSLVFRDFVPQRDAEVVNRLGEAGAITIGKTNLHELAYGATSKNPHYGPVLNPHNLERIAGGSSGGSATAVASGFVPMAIGTDTGGSIRIPASFCGITGFKPTYNLVSRRGVMPLVFSLDHVGPMGATVEDCLLTMQVIAQRWHASPLASLRGLRVCVPENFFFDRVAAEVSAAVATAITHIEGTGAIVGRARIPDLAEANIAARVIQFSEATALYESYRDPALFGPDVWALIQQGRRIAGHEYVNAQRIRSVFRQRFDALWQQWDVLVTPTTPMVAPGLNETEVTIGKESEDTRIAATRLLRAMPFLGEPALSLPCGRNTDGMPIGLQLIAAPGDDARLLQIANLVESTLAGNLG